MLYNLLQSYDDQDNTVPSYPGLPHPRFFSRAMRQNLRQKSFLVDAYCTVGKFGEEFNLANWWGIEKNRQVKNRQILIVTHKMRVTYNLRESVGIRQI